MPKIGSAARRVLWIMGIAALVAPAAAAAPLRRPLTAHQARTIPHSIILGGVTSQHWPVVLAISPDGRQLRAVVIGLEMTCTSGAVFGVNDGYVRLPINRRGRVHLAIRYPVLTNSTGSTAAIDAFSGTLNRRTATFTGSWRLRIDHTSPTGQTDHCDSGRVTFNAAL